MYFFGAFLMGAGYAPYWSLGLVYIDNNVKELHGASKYIGKSLGLRYLTPGFYIAPHAQWYIGCSDAAYLSPCTVVYRMQ